MVIIFSASSSDISTAETNEDSLIPFHMYLDILVQENDFISQFIEFSQHPIDDLHQHHFVQQNMMGVVVMAY